MSNKMKVGVAVILFFGAAIWYAWWGSLPPLLYGLPRGVNAARVALSAKLQEKFPSGTSEEVLERELTAQGFRDHVCRGSGCNPSRRSMTIDRLGPFVCKSTWFVSWWSAEGKIKAIEGGYNPSCPFP